MINRVSFGKESTGRLEAVDRALAGIIARRDSGEALSDEAVIEAHPDLMPELGDRLNALRHVEAAMHVAVNGGAADHTGRANRQSNDVSWKPISVPGYKIRSVIHYGSQGVVCLATQKSNGRKVAIKVMHESVSASSSQRVRFEREVQILGRFKHPNIVSIHESGAVDGRLYFVMDYVSGKMLDEYVRAAGLSVDEILDLTATVCEAVNAAQQRGVIHRDLKPENILIDEKGLPQILDFGLAKLSADPSPDGFPRRTVTVTGAFLGTLPWASPEQAGRNGADLDVRTDVYSLGVILFQLLTGRFPYDVSGALPEVLENIINRDPTRPSDIRPEINNEIETIVLKSLAKEPERRYQTPGELARDLRHYLADEPIEAKRDSVLYWCKKSVRQHKIPVAAAGIVLSVIVGGLITGNAMLARAWRVAEAARDETEDKNKMLIQATDKMKALSARARQAVDTMSRRAMEDLADAVGVETIRQELLEDALGFYEPLLEDEDRDPEVRYDTARAYHRSGRILEDLSGYPEAKEPYESAFGLLDKLVNEFPDNREYAKQHADVLRRLAHVETKLGKVGTGRELCERALGLWIGLVAAEPADFDCLQGLGRAYHELGHTLRQLGRYAEANDAYMRSLASREELSALAPDSLAYAKDLADSTLWTAVQLMNCAWRPLEAARAVERALDIRKTLVEGNPTSPHHRKALADAHNYLGLLLTQTRSFEKAEYHFGMARPILDELSRDYPHEESHHHLRAQNLQFQAEWLFGTSRCDDAVHALRLNQVIRIEMAEKAPYSPRYKRELLWADYSLGSLLWACETRPVEARTYFKQALTYWEGMVAAFPGDAGHREELAWFLSCCPDTSLRDPPRALKLLAESINASPTLGHQRTLGIVHYRNDDWPAAERELSAAVKRGDDERVTLLYLSMARAQLGDADGALEAFEQASRSPDKSGEDEPIRLPNSPRRRLGRDLVPVSAAVELELLRREAKGLLKIGEER